MRIGDAAVQLAAGPAGRRALRKAAATGESRSWSCGYCAPGGAGNCRDVRRRCREVWAGFAPATPDNPDGAVLCACAMAGHPAEKVVPVVPVTDVPLPQDGKEVA